MDFKGIFFFVLFSIAIGQSNGYSAEEESKNSTKFSFDLYREVFDKNENTVLSPFSFRVILSILYQSLNGTSKDELRDKLYLGDKVETLANQRESLTRYDSKPNIKIVNKIFLKKEGSLNPTFLNIVEELKSSIEQVDFSQSQTTANKMNQWVEEQTNGLIKNLIEPSSVTADTALFLINTLYFKAQWKTMFATSSVYKTLFTGIDGVSHNIDLMYDHGSYKVANLNSVPASVLEIPYTVGSNFVFWIMLPNTDSDIMYLKDSLSYEVIQEVKQKLVKKTYDISVPKFEIETSVDGITYLKKMGIKSIFDKYESFMLDDGVALKIDEIKQKSKIIVNTDGTEASSATYAKPVPVTIYPYFSANRPFVYMILTADTHEPIFVGHFSNPQ